MISSLIVALLAVLIFLIIDKIPVWGKLISTVYIYIFFLFNYAVLGQQEQSTFYALAGILVIVFQAARHIFAPEKKEVTQVAELKLKSKYIDILGTVIGLIMFAFLWYSVTAKQQAAMIGAPTLAVSGSLGLVTVMYLGVIENRLFFSIYDILNYSNNYISGLIPYLKILPPFVLPMFGSALSFGIFHWKTFGTVIVFPFIAFLLFLIPYIYFETDTPANVCHQFWNGLLTIGRSLTIAGG